MNTTIPDGYTWRTCPECKKNYLAKRKDATSCGPTCRWRLWYVRKYGRVPKKKRWKYD